MDLLSFITDALHFLNYEDHYDVVNESNCDDDDVLSIDSFYDYQSENVYDCGYAPYGDGYNSSDLDYADRYHLGYLSGDKKFCHYQSENVYVSSGDDGAHLSYQDHYHVGHESNQDDDDDFSGDPFYQYQSDNGSVSSEDYGAADSSGDSIYHYQSDNGYVSSEDYGAADLSEDSIYHYQSDNGYVSSEDSGAADLSEDSIYHYQSDSGYVSSEDYGANHYYKDHYHVGYEGNQDHDDDLREDSLCQYQRRIRSRSVGLFEGTRDSYLSSGDDSASLNDEDHYYYHRSYDGPWKHKNPSDYLYRKKAYREFRKEFDESRDYHYRKKAYLEFRKEFDESSGYAICNQHGGFLSDLEDTISYIANNGAEWSDYGCDDYCDGFVLTDDEYDFPPCDDDDLDGYYGRSMSPAMKENSNSGVSFMSKTMRDAA